MPVPRRRHSPSRRNKARAHKRLQAPRPHPCPKCGESKLPHRVCAACGYYKKRSYAVTVTK